MMQRKWLPLVLLGFGAAAWADTPPMVQSYQAGSFLYCPSEANGGPSFKCAFQEVNTRDTQINRRGMNASLLRVTVRMAKQCFYPSGESYPSALIDMLPEGGQVLDLALRYSKNRETSGGEQFVSEPLRLNRVGTPDADPNLVWQKDIYLYNETEDNYMHFVKVYVPDESSLRLHGLYPGCTSQVEFSESARATQRNAKADAVMSKQGAMDETMDGLEKQQALIELNKALEQKVQILLLDNADGYRIGICSLEKVDTASLSDSALNDISNLKNLYSSRLKGFGIVFDKVIHCQEGFFFDKKFFDSCVDKLGHSTKSCTAFVENSVTLVKAERDVSDKFFMALNHWFDIKDWVSNAVNAASDLWSRFQTSLLQNLDTLKLRMDAFWRKIFWKNENCRLVYVPGRGTDPQEHNTLQLPKQTKLKIYSVNGGFKLATKSSDCGDGFVQKHGVNEICEFFKTPLNTMADGEECTDQKCIKVTVANQKISRDGRLLELLLTDQTQGAAYAGLNRAASSGAAATGARVLQQPADGSELVVGPFDTETTWVLSANVWDSVSTTSGGSETHFVSGNEEVCFFQEAK